MFKQFSTRRVGTRKPDKSNLVLHKFLFFEKKEKWLDEKFLCEKKLMKRKSVEKN